MEIRLATIADIADIANLIHQTWGTPAKEDLIEDVLTQPDKPVWIARSETGLVGFCSGFTTHASDGTPRWEVDLLAVAIEARGHGLGRTLVARSIQSGRQHGAALYRGLIAVDNAASARCFEVNNFCAASTCDLWVSAPAAVQILPPHHPDSAHLIPVETLTYRGIWVEGRYDASAFAAAQQMALVDGRDTIGAVIPDGTAHDAARLHFTHVDTYRWWILSV